MQKQFLKIYFAAGQDTVIARAVLAQLTQLYMTVKLECPFYKVIEGLNTL